MEQTSRILIVEDDEVVAALLLELLPDYGIVPLIAPDAESGINLCARESVELVLTDKNLPGMSGLDLLSHVKRTYPNLDVIVMSAYADMNSVLEATHLGAYDYLIKPFESIDEVVSKIKRALEKRRIVVANENLVRHLQRANERIAEMNVELEAQVKSRTAELEHANQQLQELTLVDDVTGLHNQRFLYQRLEYEFERVLRYKQGLSIIMLDLDNFKNVNDEHDHIFGSGVLRKVGEAINTCIRSTDAGVRYGGDEYVVILPSAELEEASRVAERIRDSIFRLEFSDLGDGKFRVSCSVGVGTYKYCKAEDPRELLRCADRALFAAKEAGRNRVVVTGPEGLVELAIPAEES